MILKNKFTWLLGLVVMMASCIDESESDFEQEMKRDDLILEQHIAANNINATKAQSGFYYEKTVEKPDADQFVNADYIGIYYEMKTIDGQLIDTYMDETKEPRIFKYSQDGLWPIAITYASGLARVGEELTVYAPSYLAFGNYGYEQLILPSSNLVIKLKYAEKYTEEELIAREEAMLLEYIASEELEGFQKIEDGLYVKTVTPGDDSETVSQIGSNVSVDFELFELGEDDPVYESYTSNQPTTVSIGNSGLEFLNKALIDVYPDQEIEVLSSSFNAYDQSIQILPAAIREDLVDLGEQIDLVRPFTPIFFKAEVLDVI
jgi:FKBP-type peptidyl-prolyl cis-trans isomerase 2